MAKAILEFNLPEESKEHIQAVFVGGLLSLIHEWERYIKDQVKHGDDKPVKWETVADIWYTNKGEYSIPEEVFE